MTNILQNTINKIDIIPFLPEVEGKRYQSIPNALVYAATQTPSKTNPFKVSFTGYNADNFTMQSWVSVCGDGNSSVLDGTITVATIPTSEQEIVIENCKLYDSSEIVMTNLAHQLLLRNCQVEANHSVGALGVLILDKCNISAGYYQNFTNLILRNCYVVPDGGGNIQLENFSAYECYFNNDIDFLGNCNFYNCTLDGGCLFNDWTSPNYLLFQNCSCNVSTVTIPAGVTVLIYSGAFDGTWTNNGNLYTKAVSGLTVINNNFWNNTGEAFDDVAAQLGETETQGAIDALAVADSLIRENIQRTVTQTANGLVVGDVIRISNSVEYQSFITSHADAVAYWKMDSDWTDYVGSLDFTAVGTPAHVAGKVTNCGSFSSGNYLTQVDNALLKPATFTMSMWVRPANTGLQILWEKRASDSAYMGVVILINGGALNVLGSFDGATWGWDVSSSAITANTWYHLLITSTSGEHKAYLDGVQFGATNSTASSIMWDTSSVSAGGGFLVYTGYIDELALFDAIVSAGDIAFLSSSTGYTKAKADTLVHSDVVGIVSYVQDADTFTYKNVGWVSGLSGLTGGVTHYLSSSTAGALTDTRPTLDDAIIKPCLLALSTTTGFVMIGNTEVVSVEGIRAILTIDDTDSPYAVTASDYTVLCDTTSGTIHVDFPASPETGRIYNVRNIGASLNDVTVDGNGNNIEGAGTYAIADGNAIPFQFNGTAWYIYH